MKKFFVLALLCSFFLISCKKEHYTSSTTFSFTDDLNRTVSVVQNAKTAVLQGSLAHAWILAGGKLAGFSADFLSEIADGALNVEIGSAENIGAMMSPSVEKLLSGEYDFVVLSAAIPQHKNVADTLNSAHIPCAYFKLDTFNDYVRVMQIFCKITDDKTAFEKNVLSVQTEIEKTVKTAKETFSKSPHILLLRASSAKVSSRSSRTDATGAMLQDLGCVNIADEKTGLLEDISLEKIILEDPDFIFVTTMGASDKAEAFLRTSFEENPAWNSLRAIQENRFFILPRNLFHYKPCEKWAEAYVYLFNILSKETEK